MAGGVFALTAFCCLSVDITSNKRIMGTKLDKHTRETDMYITCSATRQKLDKAFGFNVVVHGSPSTKEIHGERRTIYTVKRPNGKKLYHAVMYGNGSVVAV